MVKLLFDLFMLFLSSVFLTFVLCQFFSSVSDSSLGAAGGGPGAGPDFSQPRFSSSLPTYLPVQCQLSGTDSAFFLREANQEVMRNGSLSSRTEPFFLHQLEPGVTPQSQPSVNCSYGNLSIEQMIPTELLRGPQPHLLTSVSQVTMNWRIKGQVVVPKVGSTRPWIQVHPNLFYHLFGFWIFHIYEGEKKLFSSKNLNKLYINREHDFFGVFFYK